MEIDVNKTQHERRQQVDEIPADALGTPPDAVRHQAGKCSQVTQGEEGGPQILEWKKYCGL